MDNKKKKQLKWQLPFLILLIIGTALIIRQQQSMPYQHDSGFVFGTVYNITYQSDKNLKKEIENELKKIDISLSMFNKNSVISRINRNEAVVPDRMFLEVFDLAQSVSKETNGAFDITVAPLVNVWGFGFKNGTPPTTHSIDSLRRFVDYRKVETARQNGAMKIKKADPRIMVDCSAIAKGYGCDVIARYFLSHDIKNFMIEIGGEIVTRGYSPKRLPWKIGVTKPNDDTLNVKEEIQTVLNVTDKAMATSGNYRNFDYKDGKKYAHTIDPTTGYPVQHSLLSATVLTKNCATADAYATAFMVMGIDKAKKVLDKHPELMAYFIYSDKNGKPATWYSDSLKDKIAK